jgi:hypothetical protein
MQYSRQKRRTNGGENGECGELGDVDGCWRESTNRIGSSANGVRCRAVCGNVIDCGYFVSV